MADLKLIARALTNRTKANFTVDGRYLVHRDGELSIIAWSDDDDRYCLRWDLPSSKRYNLDLPQGRGELYGLSWRETVETIISVVHDYETA